MTVTLGKANCADHLGALARDARALQIRFGAICRYADPAIRLRMDKLDALDLDLEEFVRSANDLADELQNEADASVAAE